MPSASSEANPAAGAPLVEPLTRREREILGLLAQGQSAPEIAQTLTLAVSSVKWHQQQLYGKLGVNSKQAALQRAAELGLLDDSAPAPDFRHNLPLQVTQFFGRENEIAQLQKRLSQHRLVTLAGSGGVGKTRLSLQVAEALLPEFADGVWFVALAPLTDPALVPQTVATALGLRDEPGRPVIDSLTDFLRPRQVLVVLDNCEHLLEACAKLADHLLHTCPRVKLLASSREPLGIDGELILAVPSLAFPAAGATLAAEQLGGYSAVRLFTDRVRLVQSDYAVTAGNAAAIARITQRLDGIPLALEMAAARLGVLDADQLADRLDDAFRLLTGGSRTALPRQQTLRATLDWSYRLLSDDQRLLLQRLSVFAGGCTLEAAEAVCSGDEIASEHVLEVLAALAAKSMITSSEQPGAGRRYHLLETVRQYAREKLNEAGETERLHARHRDYFLAYFEMNCPKLQTAEHAAWKPKIWAEQDNLRQALEWSLTDLSLVEAAPRLLIATDGGLSASLSEGQDWFRRGLELCQAQAGVSPRLHIKLLEKAAHDFGVSEPQTALGYARQAVTLSRTLGPEGSEFLMWSLFSLASTLKLALQVDDKGAFAEAEAIFQAHGASYYEHEEGLRVAGYFAAWKARMALVDEDYQQAKEHSRDSIRLYVASGTRTFAHVGYTNLGVACVHLGEYAEARQHLLAAASLIREQGEAPRNYLLFWLALAALRQGNLPLALEESRASLHLSQAIPDRTFIANNVALIAALRARHHQPVAAARLAGAAAAMYERQKQTPTLDSSLDTLLPGWRDGPERAAIQAAYAAGQAMSSDEVVAYALDGEPS